MRCAFLTMADPGDFVMDYELGIGPLTDLGWQVDTVPWREPGTDWDQYDAVYLCTPWDYPDHFDEFVAVLDRIDASSALLVNERSLVNWNMRKTYLRDLEAKGADIVPSVWCAGFDAAAVPGWFEAHATDTVIVKPEVGANAKDTFVLRDPIDADTEALLATVFTNRPFFVQPFVANIQTEGEYSLFYLGGNFSHAILKTPQAGDYRSQEEYGSEVRSVEPEAGLRAAGDRIIEQVSPQPAYVRVDLVRGADGRFLLMELELIEPSLYLRTDAGAPARFAAAFDAHCRAQN